jgi:hypothetical protein
LQAITQRLAEPLTLAERQVQPANVVREIQSTNQLLLWGMILMFIGAAIGVIGKMLMHDQIVTLVGVLVSLLGMFLAVYSSLAPTHARVDAGPPSQPELQTQSQPTRILPEERPIDYVSSITERTTDLLKPSAATPKQREGNS